MIVRKQDHTAVLVVDVQCDFTQLMNGSLAVEGTDQILWPRTPPGRRWKQWPKPGW
jgi:hypothetical protein